MVSSSPYTSDQIRRTQPRWHLQAVTKDRSVPPFLLVCLCLATGLALLGTGVTLTNSSPIVPIVGSAAANEDLVHDFYAAVNEVIATGVDNALDPLIAPNIAWCASCPDAELGASGLKRYLLTLHQAISDARITVETVVANAENLVMSRVSVSGFPMMGTAALWGPIDTFQLANGRIIARQSGPTERGVVEPLLKMRLPMLPPAVTGMIMARLTLAPHVDVSNVLSAGPTVLIVETGVLAVRMPREGMVFRAGRDERESPTTGGSTLSHVLRPGDAAFIPPGVRHGYAQLGTEPVTVLGITLSYVENGEPPSGPKLNEFDPFLPAEMLPERKHPLPMPAITTLASGVVDAWPTGPVEIALGRAIVSPGRNVVPGATETVLMAVDVGSLTVVDLQPTDIIAGEGMMRPAGTVRGIRNSGTGQAIFLVFTVAPALI